MSALALAAAALGAMLCAGSLAALYAPDAARRALQAFSRHDTAGWLLTAGVVLWLGWLALRTPPFSVVPRIEPLVYVGGPLLFFILVIFLDELLAARAFAGLLLLAAHPLLAAARAHPSRLSVIVTLLAYAAVVAGMVWVVSPFRLRRLLARWTAGRERYRWSNLAVLAAGAGLLVLGLLVY